MARGKKTEKILTQEEKLQQALVPESERPYKVPENWRWTIIGKITQVIGGGTPSSGVKEYYEKGNIPWISPADLSGYSDIYISHGNKNITELGLEKSSARLLPKDTVCLSSRAPIGYVAIALNPLSTNQGFKSFLPSPAFLSRYLYWYLKGNKELLENRASGTTFLELSGSKAASIEFPLPPLPEQQRIVDRIESLFAKLDEAKEKTQAVVDGFEDRKAAILHKAFTGELTARWRETHGFTLNSWEQLKWGDFLESIEAGKNRSALGRPPEEGEFGVVKVSAVTWGEFNELESKTCELPELWNEKVQIEEGDFLFSRANTLQLVGNCVIVRQVNRKLMLSDKILRFSFDDSVIPEYVLYYTRSDLYRKQVEELASGNQDGMRNISQKNLRLIQFPIPSKAEQEQIIIALTRTLDYELTAKESAEQIINQIDVMKSSILARAFHGELGTNDPSEESAEELLRKIL